MFKYVIYTSYSAGFELAKIIRKSRQLIVVTPETGPYKNIFQSEFGQNSYFFKCINEEKLLEMLKAYSPDFIISCVFSSKIPDSQIALSNYLSVNIHPSKLPMIRTGDSSFWNILLEKKYYHVSIHKLTNQWDKGDILRRDRIPMDEFTTKLSLIESFRIFIKNNAKEYQNFLEDSRAEGLVE